MIGGAYNRFQARKRRDLRVGHKGPPIGERLRLTDNLDDLHRNMASTWIEPEIVMAGNLSEPHIPPR